MAKERAIVSRLSALEELSGMEVLCSDKTGTLTLNNLTLDESEVEPWGEHTKEKVLEIASLSAKWSNQVRFITLCCQWWGGDVFEKQEADCLQLMFVKDARER